MFGLSCSMAARTAPAVVSLASRLIKAAGGLKNVLRVVSCHPGTRNALSPSRVRFDTRRHRSTSTTPTALPNGSQLESHPLMSLKTGRYSIRDFDLVIDEIEVDNKLPPIKIVRPKSEDDVLDMYVDLGLLDQDPYWAALWPSSIALARSVASDNKRSVVRDKDVCDLGAGLGLAGITAGVAGARSVTFYDREPLALQCCLLSAEANGLRVSFDDQVSAAPMGIQSTDDGDTTKSNDINKSSSTVSATLFDWNAVPKDQEKFDLILACDVLYEKHAVEPVAALVPQLTVEKSGVWLVADPPLRAPRNREAFIDLLDASESHKLKLNGKPTESKVTHKGSTDTVLLLEFRTQNSE